ncbi:MAG: copper amine oxidase [Firmicutes bacterium HGW-Firmicutes-13]|nr:MAG: copper amine oxidase [Firmicutes bacterium HGW-Firmicutes-13]
MKKLLILILAAAFFLCGYSSGNVSAQENLPEQQGDIPVMIDGLPVIFDVQPIIQNGRVLVPFRAIAEALKVEVVWDGETRTVTAADNNNQVILQIGEHTAIINCSSSYLDVPPLIHNQRTLIPLRFFSEAFNCDVKWIDTAREVKITSPPKPMRVTGFYALGDSQTSSWTNLFGDVYPNHGKGNTDIVSELALGWYSIDGEGNILTRSRTGWQRPAGWERVLETADIYGLYTEMVIHETNKYGILSSLLAGETAMENTVNGIMDEVKLYKGVNLNLEGLGLSEKGDELLKVQQRFTNFVRMLSEQLRPNGKTITLTLHAPNSVYKGYDYQALGKLADRIIIMAYDYGPRPEPVSQVIRAVEIAKAVVPPEKLVLGISAPSETSDSMHTKVGIAKRYDLNGIALWRLGLITGEMWDMLRSAVLTRTV